MFNDLEENEKIRRAMLGDTAALSQLLQMHYAFVYKYLVKITLNPSHAEDLTQDTMARCIEKIKLYNGTSKFSSWLITIATRLMIDQERRRRSERRWQEQEQQQALRQLEWHTSHRRCMAGGIGRLSRNAAGKPNPAHSQALLRLHIRRDRQHALTRGGHREI